jgi:hypothetical protein
MDKNGGGSEAPQAVTLILGKVRLFAVLLLVWLYRPPNLEKAATTLTKAATTLTRCNNTDQSCNNTDPLQQH